VERRDLGRIVAFTDGVMAVAITLLVLNLEVPRVPRGDVDEALWDLIPSLISYLIAFALVGRHWIVHHQFFETLRNFDARLMTLNLAFLSMIVLVPFGTELFDRYTQDAVAVAVFGAIMGVAALINWTMVVHTLRRGYVHDTHRGGIEPFGSAAGLGFTILYLGSVPVAFLSTLAAILMWVATIFVHYPLQRMGGARAS
jgi:uncharacterized membrane protein